jgi:hypothetical protein
VSFRARIDAVLQRLCPLRVVMEAPALPVTPWTAPTQEPAMSSPKDPDKSVPAPKPEPKPTGIPPERLSDDPGAYSEHQEDVAGKERGSGVPHETPRDDRETRTGFRTGND